MRTEYRSVRQTAITLLQSRTTRTAALLGAGLLAISLLGLGTTSMAVNVVDEPWDKLLHFCTYAGLTALVALGFGGRRPWLTIGVVVTLACVDEGLQLYEPGRHADLDDLLVDIVAAISVTALSSRLLPVRN